MSRLQLALNVADIDAAVEFYTTLFDTAPAKRRPGYANFAVVDPPLAGAAAAPTDPPNGWTTRSIGAPRREGSNVPA